MKIAPLLLVIAVAVTAPFKVAAQDVNNPLATPLDRPPGPPSAPGIVVNEMPRALPVPSAEPGARIDERATTVPRIDKATSAHPSRNAEATPPPDSSKRAFER